MTQQEIMDMAKKMADEHLVSLEAERSKISSVRERFPGIDWPNVYTRPAAYVDGTKYVTLDGRVAIVADTIYRKVDVKTQVEERVPYTAFYSFASNYYKILPHEIALLKVEESLQEIHNEYGKAEVTPKIFQNGGRMTININFPEVDFKVGPRKDQLNPSLEVRNSYDMSWEFEIAFKARQKVCTNGLYAMKRLQRIGRKHRKSLDIPRVVKSISEYMGKFSEQIGMWNDWSGKVLSQETVSDVFEALDISNKRKEEIMGLKLMGRGVEVLKALPQPTMWDLNSAITQFLTHNIESDMVKIDLGQRLTGVMERVYLGQPIKKTAEH
uniref:DUF932 domain-containing protein n=1 Tax=viral metagenome TaxID=1070528 RepID=A0A6M3KNE2_9ZZZZ